MRVKHLVILFSFGLLVLGLHAQDNESAVVIKAGLLIDGTGAEPISDGVVVVRGEKIEAVGTADSVEIPADAEVIDLGSDTLMPGLVNSHAHFSIRNDDKGIFGILRNGIRHDGQQMTWAVRHVRNELLSGATTVRTTGDSRWIDVYLYEAIRNGTVPGPRIITSGLGLAPTGGHGYLRWMVDGPWAIRKHIRWNLEHGATQMKFGMNDSTADATDYTQEEIEAGVDELHRNGRWATAHAVGAYGSSTKAALTAGMDSIEHATPLDDSTLPLYQQYKGAVSLTWLVSRAFLGKPIEDPDSYHVFVDQKANSISDVIDFARQKVKKFRAENPQNEKTRMGTRDPFSVDLNVLRQGPEVAADGLKQWEWIGHGNIGGLDRKTRQTGIGEKLENFYKFYKAGVTVGIGLDGPYGCMPLFVEMLAEGPFSAHEAIQVATQGSADTIGWGDKLGTLEVGKYADIISLKENPLENIQTLSSPNFLMVNGVNYTGLSYR